AHLSGGQPAKLFVGKGQGPFHFTKHTQIPRGGVKGRHGTLVQYGPALGQRLPRGNPIAGLGHGGTSCGGHLVGRKAKPRPISSGTPAPLGRGFAGLARLAVHPRPCGGLVRPYYTTPSVLFTSAAAYA